MTLRDSNPCYRRERAVSCLTKEPWLRRGFEPTTDRLTADSSTTELLRNNMMERVMGIEPTTSAWKAEVLPLNYTRVVNDYGAVEGIEPSNVGTTIRCVNHFATTAKMIEWFRTESNCRHGASIHCSTN